MRKILVLLMVAALALYGYGKQQRAHDAGERAFVGDRGAADDSAGRTDLSRAPTAQPAASTPATTQFTCDGRTQCSAMTSCAEATYFIEHCPNTRMDGNHDGVPCESQWCH